MNLLVTNTRNAQAYGIIRSLRPHAEKIVATMYGANRVVARLSHAANSRFVDRRYLVPSPIEDWRNGRIQRQNTEREEEYIEEILRICNQESIDVIFPSWEPMVYLFSKNKDLFQSKNILIPIPDYDELVVAMDKYEVIRAAEKVGFPVPKTFALNDEGDLGVIERELDYPMVLKPRMSSGSKGFCLVRNRSELGQMLSVRSNYGPLLVQEYVPGAASRRFASIWMVLDQKGTVKAAMAHRRLRTVFRDASSQGTAWESFEDGRLIAAATALCRALKIYGMINIQTKQDPRDNLNKLLEINPRIGYNFWIPWSQGIDTPLLTLKVAMGEEFEAVTTKNGKTVFIALVPDMWALGVHFMELFAARVLGYHPMDPENSPLSLTSVFRAYRETYMAPNKVFDPFFTNFFSDPLVSLSWWAAFGVFNLQQRLEGTRSLLRVSKG